MSMQRTKLADIQTIDDTAASIYVNPSSTKTYIRSIVLHNTDSGAQAVKLYNVPDSAGSLGTPTDTNRFLAVSVAADETVVFDLDYPIVLTATNDALFAEAEDADLVTVQVMGDTDA